MCFHTAQTKKVQQLESRFNVLLDKHTSKEKFDQPAYHLNGFAHPEMLIIPQEEPSILINATWGIAPNTIKPQNLNEYYKKAIQFGGGLNAQSEKLFSHFIYKYSANSKKCLIPVTGFFEPHEFNKKKYPYHIKRQDKDTFALAGLYTILDNTITFTILTKTATPYFAEIHNVKKRQPVLLTKENEQLWLEDHLSEKDINNILQNKYPKEELENYPVSKDLFNPRLNSNEDYITEPFNYPELSNLF